MFEYKVLCSNYPLDVDGLSRMGQEGWMLCACANISPDDDVHEYHEKPKGMKQTGEKIKFTWYFRRPIV